MNIIDVAKINSYLELKGDEKRVNEILTKSLELKGLGTEEIAVLLNLEDENLLNKLFRTAKKVKEGIYGKRIVLFAPLYLSNYCCNNCLYCGFRRDNKEIKRRKLTFDEAVHEAEQIINMGHKRILLVAGEDTNQCNLDYIKEIIDKIYEKKIMNGEVRRINVNMAPLKTEEFKRLASFGIGTFQSFQETYHPDVYKKMHLSGPKANYQWRLETMDRAIEGGIQDFGMGALFGLCDYRFEVLALIEHSKYLLNKYGVGPHTLSVPRIEPASGSDLSKNPPHAINDKQFKKIVAILRLAVPYTGMILTTRESAQVRREVIELGISQISAGSKTNPGGYSDENSTEQFTMGDTRSLDEIVEELAQHGFIPSFCTSCYRLGRVGKDFMDLAQVGLIQRFCDPNAVATFAEYLNDYASEETKKAGFEAIENHIKNNIKDEKIRAKVIETLDKIQNGARDLYV
ncbi:MAG TPA: [FeFe] hydrogenase H-cluster radical SAM maturase HydG [Candidatus Gastranaerophilaceae bacterium]|nr:[FeFe] hydrogenase H-cluster radical SAM maturase HydG [Candidatus Gastranaerophilaceae bacterium]HPT40956.1 [FeFe] hydrogenase H-cluster radical SAM maturase HydG [Candidatus Gastranaerophilaceae bacterium]